MPILKLLEYLYSMGVQSLFVEGGASIHGSFYDEFKKNNSIIDQIIFYYSPIIIGGNNSLSVFSGIGYEKLNMPELKNIQIKQIKNNFKLNGFFNFY